MLLVAGALDATASLQQSHCCSGLRMTAGVADCPAATSTLIDSTALLTSARLRVEEPSSRPLLLLLSAASSAASGSAVLLLYVAGRSTDASHSSHLSWSACCGGGTCSALPADAIQERETPVHRLSWLGGMPYTQLREQPSHRAVGVKGVLISMAQRVDCSCREQVGCRSKLLLLLLSAHQVSA